MNPTYSAEAESFRISVREFLQDELPAGWKGMGRLGPDEVREFMSHWRVTLGKSGYLAAGWPAEYGGGGMSELEQVIIAEEFARAGVPTGGPNDVFNIHMLGNTLLRWGTEEQKKYHLPRLLNNEDVYCQGFSEPNAGSDLSNLGLKGVLDGDQWILNGQKFGPVLVILLITSSHSHAPMLMRRATRESVSFLLTCVNRELKCARSR
jgi:alkylation response protein AidB-like acyl-CoA dehydrogenase